MFSQLSQRERIALIVCGIVVLVTLLFAGVISPYREAMDRLDVKIASRSRQLKEVQTLKQEFQVMQGQLREAEKRLSTSATFSLFSFVETVTAQVATKENLVYMRPQPAAVQDDIREESVEIKLEKIRLDQLINLLYEIDTAKSGLLQVKNLRLKTRFNDRSLFDAVLTISSYGRNA